ncbi:MAG: heavy metal translocating P-type ATPase [Chthoniobacteraceae bacterium]
MSLSASDRFMRLKLVFVIAAALLLAVGFGLGRLLPGQGDLAACWSLAGALVAALPIAGEAIECLRRKSAEPAKLYIAQFILLAVVACIAGGQFATGGIVAIILAVGQMLEDRSMLGSNEAIQTLLKLSRTVARRVSPGGGEEEIDATLLKPDDLIRLRPGDVIPADGVVATGRSSVNQANITGESLPVEVETGAAVFAGTTNLTGPLEVRVTEAGPDTLLGKVRHIVEEAQATRAPIMRITEEYARYYMPLILLICGFVFFFTRDLQRAIAVLIVSVPCAFILAGPAAMIAALAAASRLGILVKSVRLFEAASHVSTVVFDKTGTLTTGRLRVTRVDPAEGVSRDELLAWAAALETHSNHPLARSIVRAATERALEIPEALEVCEEHGLGVEGRMGEGNLLAGRAAWLTARGITIATAPDAAAWSAIHVARNGLHAGTVYLADTLRTEAPAVPAQLRKSGIERFVMLTGDRREVAAAIAGEIGFGEFQAECLPAQKQEAVEALKADGETVLVVGDGVNDAPALAAADLSIAMGALGSPVAIQTADIALMSDDLRRVPQFVELSKRTLAIINQNMLCGLVFIVISIAISSAGLVSPMAASVIHELGAFFVIFNSARLLSFEGSN